MFNRYEARFGITMAMAGALALAACGTDGDGDGGGIDPTDVAFGDTALVVVVNPVINDGNDEQVPTPGATQAGVTVTTDDGLTAVSDARGIAVLAPVTAGARTIELAGDGVGGQVSVTIGEGELREVAIASDGDTAQVMLDIDYKTDQVVEVTPEMSIEDVNAALSDSDRVVFVRGGTYVGDLDFSGSRVTLFGESVLGGEVVIDGNVVVSGSDSRIRGASITGDLTIPASGVGVSFSRVDGATAAEGSDGTLLANELCGAITIEGSGVAALGNVGLAPSDSCR
jgi:hypothetical protein